MKYILFLVLIFNFTYSDLLEYKKFDDALKQAQTNNKPIMLMYGQDGCQACKIMHDKTFEDIELTDFIEENFNLAYLNLTHNKRLRGYPVRGTPTFYFIDKNKKVLSKLIGALNVQNMKKHIDGVLLNINATAQ